MDIADRECLQLRQTYMSCMKLAEETDSKKETAYLKAEAKNALDSLRKVCKHNETVCLHSQYEGSYSMDYDDSHKESRICLCCGVEEYEWKDSWKILKVKPFARFENKYPDQMKNPLSYLLTEAVQVAEEQGYQYHGWGN